MIIPYKRATIVSWFMLGLLQINLSNPTTNALDSVLVGVEDLINDVTTGSRKIADMCQLNTVSALITRKPIRRIYAYAHFEFNRAN